MHYLEKLINVIWNEQKSRAPAVSKICDVSLFICSAPSITWSLSNHKSLHEVETSKTLFSHILHPFTSFLDTRNHWMTYS